jgi:hypothetical protein
MAVVITMPHRSVRSGYAQNPGTCDVGEYSGWTRPFRNAPLRRLNGARLSPRS